MTTNFQRPEDMRAQFDRCIPQFSTPSPAEQEKLTDNAVRQADTKRMSDITREELNAKLEATEARMDGRVAAIEGKIDTFLAAQAEQQKFNEYRFNSLEKNVSEMRSEIKTDLKSLRSTIIVTALTTVLAIVIGVASFNAALTSNMLGAFQAGKDTTSAPPVIPVSK